MTKKPARPKPYRTIHRYGILNRHGDFWTAETFVTAAEARAHLVDYWKNFPGKPSAAGFKVVRARVTVSLA